MSVRRDRQLALAAFGEAPITWHNGSDLIGDHCEQLPPLCFGETATLSSQCGRNRVRATHGLTEPGQVIPDRQVVNELVRGVSNTLRRRQRLRDRGQLEIGAEA